MLDGLLNDLDKMEVESFTLYKEEEGLLKDRIHQEFQRICLTCAEKSDDGFLKTHELLRLHFKNGGC